MASPTRTRAEVAALWGQPDKVATQVVYPNPHQGTGDRAPDVQETEFRYMLTALAAGIPVVDEANFLPPIVFKEDFLDTASAKGAEPMKFSLTADEAPWFVTEVDGATGQTETVIGVPVDGTTSASAQGGWGLFTTCNAAADLLCCQMNGESFKCAVGKPLYFEARLAIGTVATHQVFVGLCDGGCTDAYNAAAGDASGHIGFMITAGNISFSVLESGGTQKITDTGTDFVDGTIATLETANVVHRLGFYWDGVDTVTPYVDGVAITAAAVTDGATYPIPDSTCLSPCFQIEDSATVSGVLWMDYIMVAQAR